ncbi:MAG: hypothetical protein ABR976_09155 [Terracidiphilus sp.]|jgi:DNA-binding transcriptional ArsR family regulator
MSLKKWVRLPSDWINYRHGLKRLQWKADGAGSDAMAALMALTAITHHANDQSGIAWRTYDDLCFATGLSRAKLSNGLDVLEKLQVIERMPEGRSTYKLSGFNPNERWAKLPAQGMYTSDRIAAFKELRLRKESELNALKLYFLFVARRSRETNMAQISYSRIEEYTGVERAKIKSATSLLAALSLIYVEHLPTINYASGIANAYRIVGIDTYKHMGTQGRAMTAYDFDNPEKAEVEVPF